MTEYEFSSLCISGIQSVLATIGIGFGGWQIYALVKQVEAAKQAVEAANNNVEAVVEQVKIGVDANRISRLASLLTLEETITNARLQIEEEKINLSTLENKMGASFPCSEDDINSARIRLSIAEDTYLSALDRLCFCLLNKHIEEDEVQGFYHNKILKAVQEEFKPKLERGTNHRNIVKVYDRWVDLKRVNQN